MTEKGSQLRAAQRQAAAAVDAIEAEMAAFYSRPGAPRRDEQREARRNELRARLVDANEMEEQYFRASIMAWAQGPFTSHTWEVTSAERDAARESGKAGWWE